jgi:anti-sigma regulatory factor (Ser/Thr protein kinase)
MDEDGIVLRFEDDGIAFDPLQAPEPNTPSSIDEAVPGGLGIKLLRGHCRSAHYRRLGDRNVLTVGISPR